jgi:hypothetical protein
MLVELAMAVLVELGIAVQVVSMVHGKACILLGSRLVENARAALAAESAVEVVVALLGGMADN